MNEETKEKIRKAVAENIDDLEDELNIKLRKILKEIGVDDDDAITHARQVFFQG